MGLIQNHTVLSVCSMAVGLICSVLFSSKEWKEKKTKTAELPNVIIISCLVLALNNLKCNLLQFSCGQGPCFWCFWCSSKVKILFWQDLDFILIPASCPDILLIYSETLCLKVILKCIYLVFIVNIWGKMYKKSGLKVIEVFKWGLLAWNHLHVLTGCEVK